MEEQSDSKYLNNEHLKYILVSSLIVTGLILITSLLGIVIPDIIYPTEELMIAFLPTDVVNIVIALPILLISLWYTKKQNLLGILC